MTMFGILVPFSYRSCFLTRRVTLIPTNTCFMNTDLGDNSMKLQDLLFSAWALNHYTLKRLSVKGTFNKPKLLAITAKQLNTV